MTNLVEVRTRNSHFAIPATPDPLPTRDDLSPDYLMYGQLAAARPAANDLRVTSFNCGELGVDAVKQLLVRVTEPVDPLAFELGGDRSEIDAGGSGVCEDELCRVEVAVERAGDLAVIGEGSQCRFGHGQRTGRQVIYGCTTTSSPRCSTKPVFHTEHLPLAASQPRSAT
jgi:hypothetical protein